MLKNITSFLNPNYQNLNWRTVFLALFLIAFFIRFPFFFRDYVDRDESTFIIMAQSWVDGHLPYTQLWDLKPPMTFLFFALIIKVFGKSFIAIRFFGVILVALTALFTYGIGRWATSQKVSFWCSVFCVFLLSLFGSLQGVMSEHICTLFFVIGVYLLLSKESRGWYFAIGILFGLSVMSKLNMAYPLLSLAIYLTWGALAKRQFWHNFQRLVFMGIGFAVLLALTATPYYLQGEITTWWESIFEAPLAYSGSKQHSVIKTLPFVFVILGLLYAGFASKVIDFKSKPLQLLTVITIGILLSFMQAGKVNGHYLIQLYPFILIAAGIAISKLPLIKKKYTAIIVFLFVLLPAEAYVEYVNIISNKIEKGTFFNGEGIDVPKYIIENEIETKNIFFTEYHIGYWVLDETPPTKAATHPSSITREELFPFMKNPRKTGIEELHYILEEIRPKTIIARKGKKIFDKKLEDFNSYIDNYLEKHYKLIKTIDRGLIYQRL
ncbi:ArnT family glycosyltransferase [Flagellimonas hymeniacidonis]|uniref:ArnT family glycosyltransferase n=1 Tax=Flagellimonas hymeniacidonis TaxID=2603628 RepID=UPI001650A8CC|nr:glycosyltransferase family 39 protein [Flagellimonas hymeniacidonis]